MNIDGDLISQFILTLDDQATIVLRGLMFKLEDKMSETGFKKKEFTDDEADLIHQLADLFERE